MVKIHQVLSEEKIVKIVEGHFPSLNYLVVMATRILNGNLQCLKIWKSTTQGTFLWNLVEIDPVVSEKKIFIDLVAMATTVHDGRPLFLEICNRTTKGTFLWNLVEIGPVVSEKKIFKYFPSFKCLVAMATRILQERP